MKVTKDLTQGNIYKNYLQYALPLVFASLVSSLYTTVDAMIAGKFISENALGAISATGSYDILFQGFFDGFVAGFSIYVAHLFGKGEYARLKRDIINMTIFVSGLALAVSVLSIVFRKEILDYLNVDAALLKDAEIYFTIFTAGYVFMFFNLSLRLSLYSLGVTSASLYVSIVSSVLNIGGNLLAVLVFDMGVAGLAYSSVFAVLAGTVIYVAILLKAYRELKCEKKYYRFELSCVKNSLRYTIPTSIQKMAFHATGIFVSPAINGLGADATTGYSVMTRMYNICANSFWSTCTAVDCYTAQSVGKGEYKRLRLGLWAGLWVNVAMLTPLVVVFTFFAEPIASVFFPAGYRGVAFEYAIRFFQVYSLSLYINMLGHLMHSFMRSIGQVNAVLWITIAGSVTRVAATLLLIPPFHMDGVYIGQVASWTVDALLCVIIYFLLYYSEKQMKKIVDQIQARQMQ